MGKHKCKCMYLSDKGLELSLNDDGNQSSSKSTCCPKGQAFDGKTCVQEGLMKCPSGWGCSGYGDKQCVPLIDMWRRCCVQY